MVQYERTFIGNVHVCKAERITNAAGTVYAIKHGMCIWDVQIPQPQIQESLTFFAYLMMINVDGGKNIERVLQI